MAAKGTYGAYVSQPNTPSGEFAGASQFARMAGVTAQKKAEERAEQKQLRDEARESIRLAIDASNIDLSQIEASVHGGVAKMLDSYAERLTDMIESMETNYSFDKQMELAKLKSQFQSNVTAMASIGTNNKYVTSGEWDNLISNEAVNGNTRFMMELPQILEKMDPATMAVDGKRIDAVYRDYVDFSKLVPPIDSEGLFDGLAERLMDRAQRVSEFEGNNKIGYELFTYNDKEVIETYNTLVAGTMEEKKAMISLLNQYDSTPDNEKDMFQYVTIDDNGEAYVSSSDVFRYFRDTKLPERVETSREELPPKEISSTDRKNARSRYEELLNKQRNIDAIDEAFTPTGMVIKKGETIKIGNNSFEINRANSVYNWQTGEDQVGVWYDQSKGAAEKVTGLKTYSLDMTGRQELGNNVFGEDMDYELDIQELGHVPKYTPLNFADRHESIAYQSEVIANNIISVYNQSRGESTHRHEDAIDRVIVQLSAFGLDSDYVRAFIKDNSAKTGGWLGFGGKWGIFGEDYLGNTKHQEQRAKAIAFGAMYAESLQKDGMSEKDIRSLVGNKVQEFINNNGESLEDFGYEFDPVIRFIRSNAGDERKQQEMIKEAYSFKRDMADKNKPVSDKQLIQHLKSGKKTETNPANMSERDIESKLKESGIPESEINQLIEAGINEDGLTRKEALEETYKYIFGN